MPVQCSAILQRIIGFPLKRSGQSPKLTQKFDKVESVLRRAQTFDDLYVSLVSEWEKLFSLVVGADEQGTLLQDRSAWPSLTRPEARI